MTALKINFISPEAAEPCSAAIHILCKVARDCKSSSELKANTGWEEGLR